MNNKVLVKVITPHFNGEYDVFIPTNEYVYVVTKLIVKVLKDINEAGSNSKTVFQLMNVDTGAIYKQADIVRDTDIRNSTKLMLI